MNLDILKLFRISVREIIEPLSSSKSVDGIVANFLDLKSVDSLNGILSNL